MTTTRLRLQGSGTKGARLPAPMLRDLLRALVPAVQRAVRLRLEGRSSAPGSTPAWLEQAAAFDIVGAEPGSTVLNLDCPTLLEAARDRVRQVEMFSDLDPAQTTCLDLFTESLEDALAGNADSDRYDDGLLASFGELQRVFRHGIDSLELSNRVRFTIRPEQVAQLDALKRSIAPDQRVIVAGTLDAMRHSDRMFTLQLEGGATLLGLLDDHVPLDQLRPLWGKQVRVSGAAKFRPSGSVLRVEVDDVREATGDVSLWSAMPRPALAPLDPRALRRSQGPRSGVSAIFGKWPGDERDDTFDDAISELS